MLIRVTKSGFIAERGVAGRVYVEGEIVDASAGLVKAFFDAGYGRELTVQERAEYEAEPSEERAVASRSGRTSAAIQTPGGPSLIS